MPNDEDRIEELAQNEDLNILWNALYSALEADLSGLGWPKNSRVILSCASEEIEKLISLAEERNS